MLQALTIKKKTKSKPLISLPPTLCRKWTPFSFIRVNGTTCNISNSISEFKLISRSRSDPEPPSGCNYACPLVPFFSCQGEISPHRAGTLTGHCCLKQLRGTVSLPEQNKTKRDYSHLVLLMTSVKYQFIKRQDLNSSCSAAQQTLQITGLWLMPRRHKSIGSACAGSPGKLRQTLQLNYYSVLFTQS